MKKEMIISVLVGLVFGLIIVYGVYTAQDSLSTTSQSIEELNVSPSPDLEVIENGILALHSPEDEIVVNEPAITITGTTKPESYIVVFINDNENIITSDEAGHFSVKGELELGSNIIEVHALDEDGQTVVIERTVIYTTKPLVEEDNLEESASESAKTNNDE
ncbi:hypothetical protein KJ628_00500 [Patescibacteria group bacterium]|nr:hypothetical protein [Patescibacteria group bacterium]